MVLSATTEVGVVGGWAAAGQQSKAQWKADTAERYNGLLDMVTLAQLSQAFPEASWQGVLRNGWVSMSMDLLLADRRFLEVCLYTNLAGLGVSPKRGDTYASSEHDRSYDCGRGWLRSPAFTPKWRHVENSYLDGSPLCYPSALALEPAP